MTIVAVRALSDEQIAVDRAIRDRLKALGINEVPVIPEKGRVRAIAESIRRRMFMEYVRPMHRERKFIVKHYGDCESLREFDRLIRQDAKKFGYGEEHT
jgi:hypothetical protein